MTRSAAIVLGASADIGAAIALRLARDGWEVVGTFRSRPGAEALEAVEGVSLLRCDVSLPDDIRVLADAIAQRGIRWRLFVAAVGRLDPIGRWEELDFEAWERSVRDNSTSQLAALHALLPHRADDGAHVAFFAGGGTNGPFTNYSAYCLGKIALIKMCELIHDEIPDLNAFIIGPGFLPTKIHAPTLANPEAAGENHRKTLAFYDDAKRALSTDDVYDCLRWCVEQGRDVVGGRNVAAAHDPWRGRGATVAAALRGAPDTWRLRRTPLPDVR